MNVYQMLEAQSKTIKMLQEERLKTVEEANRLMLKYQGAIDIAQKTIDMLRTALEQKTERVKQLECEALGRSWDASNPTKPTDKKGGM